MTELTPSQRAMRARFESLISIAAPFLDVLLGVGERISRIAEPTDHEYYPIRSGGRQRLPGEGGEPPGEERSADGDQPPPEVPPGSP